MRKQILGIVLAFGLSGCTQHDATDPVVDVDRSELAGTYEYMAFFDSGAFCEYAWLELAASGSFVLYYNVLFDVAEPCSAHQAEAEAMPEFGGWEGTYANLGTFLAFESTRQYIIDESGAPVYFDVRTDLTGSYDPDAGSIAVQFADPWGFGEGGGGGSKTGGKEAGAGFGDLEFFRD
ncbi:MAG TPA: hypothetical protein VMN78_13005 [Longimicrobiales bacterium]|nr:hypothetical protein [Longimicrobiales bacterium]